MMKTLPNKIIRLDDGAEFILKENGMYSLKESIELEKKGYLINEYSYHTLMVIHRTSFKVADGTEDLVAMRKAWLETMGGMDHH